MDRKLLDNKRAYEGDDCFKPADDPVIQPAQKTAKEKQGRIDNLVGVLAVTMDHFFPRFNEWLGQISDRRNQGRITYDRQTIIWAAINLMLTKRGSRKRIGDEMRVEKFCRNLKELSGQQKLEAIPHGDTVEYFCLGSREEDFEKLQVKMMRGLFRMRVLERYRLQNKYHSVAIDGYHICTFNYPHCPDCLVKKGPDGKKRWYHYKLGAFLVTPDGFCLPMASVWVKNEGRNDKQDCELKALPRLAKKFRELYPQLPICVLLDGLYARQTIFDVLNKQGMEWIVVAKEGVNREAQPWVMNWKDRFARSNVLIKKSERVIPLRNRRRHEEKFIRGNPRHQTRSVIKEIKYTWMKDIQHWDGKRKFNVMTCKEVEDNQKNCDYIWFLSDGLRLEKDTVAELSERGRCRWKIENEGINIQKNGGYHLEHCYSRDPVAMKVWGRIIDIAYTINQLIERGSLIVKKAFGSVRNIANRLFEHFRYFIFKKPETRPRIQIRLGYDTS